MVKIPVKLIIRNNTIIWPSQNNNNSGNSDNSDT